METLQQYQSEESQITEVEMGDSPYTEPQTDTYSTTAQQPEQSQSLPSFEGQTLESQYSDQQAVVPQNSTTYTADSQATEYTESQLSTAMGTESQLSTAMGTESQLYTAMGTESQLSTAMGTESQLSTTMGTESQLSPAMGTESQLSTAMGTESQLSTAMGTESQLSTAMGTESQLASTMGTESQLSSTMGTESQLSSTMGTDSQTSVSQMVDSQPQISSNQVPAVQPEVPLDSELGKYWTAVRDNPGDFTGWTYLLQYVEQECSLTDARPAFEEFLGRYPYCYGYWKKYADLERKHNNLDQCEQVFEKGLKAIALSIDLWIHYITFAQEKYETDLDKETKVRMLFERSLAAAGTDFRSDKLWDMYLYWEQDNKNLKNITNIYDRVLAIPTQLYAQHFENFSKHVNTNKPQEFLSLDEFLKLRQHILKKDAPKEDVAEDTEEVVAVAAVPPGMEAPPGAESSLSDNPPGLDTGGIEDEAEIAAMRQMIVEQRQAVHKLNEQEVSRRWTFEEGIRRPYFHVKPLEKVQLKNWREYLDFEIEYGTHERTVILFERCLIACALYEEFWMRYAKFMEQHNNEAVRSTYTRACTIYLRKKPNIHLAWSSFEERLGYLDVAKAILTNFEQEVSRLAMVSLRVISLERRQGHFDAVEALYRKYMGDAENDQSRSFYAIKFARYQAKILRNVTAARETLHAALEKDRANSKLYLQLMDLEYQQPDINEAAVIEVFQKALDGDLPMEHKITFSQRRMEFMEDFCTNVAKVQQAYEDHQKLLKDQNAQAGKKRKGSTLDDPSGEKKSKADESQITNGTSDASQTSSQSMSQPSAPSQPVADYNAHNQWNYGQQWNTGYNNMPYQYNPWGPYSNTYYG